MVALASLADVVKQRPEHKEIGPGHVTGEVGGVGGRLHQVSIDREAVVCVALRARPHDGPLGQDATDHVVVVECFEHRDGGVSGEEERHEVVDRSGRPRRRERGRVARQTFERRPLDHRAMLGGRRRHAQHERRIGGQVGGGVEVHLAVAQHDPRGHRHVTAVLASARPVHRRRHPSPRLVARPRDRARRLGDGGHEGIGVAIAQAPGDAVLVLKPQDITRSSGEAVQLDASVEQDVVGQVEAGRLVEAHEVSRFHPMQRVDVTQTAASILEVRLEQEGHLARRRVATLDRGAQLDEPRLGPLAPAGKGPGSQVVGQALVTHEMAGVEERRSRRQVVGRQAGRFLHGAHGVAELHLRVPDRIPQPFGHGGDAVLHVVQQQKVEVAERRQLATAVAADGNQGDGPVDDAGRGVEQTAQPVVGNGRQLTTKARAATIGLVQQRLTSLHRHA